MHDSEVFDDLIEGSETDLAQVSGDSAYVNVIAMMRSKLETSKLAFLLNGMPRYSSMAL